MGLCSQRNWFFENPIDDNLPDMFSVLQFSPPWEVSSLVMTKVSCESIRSLPSPLRFLIPSRSNLLTTENFGAQFPRIYSDADIKGSSSIPHNKFLVFV